MNRAGCLWVISLLIVIGYSVLPAAAQTADDTLNQAMKAHGKGDNASLQQAIGLYTEVAQSSTVDCYVRQARFAIGACQFSLKNYDAAIEAFQTFASTWPDDFQGPLALVEIGNCLIEGRQAYDLAQPYFQQALQISQPEVNKRVWWCWAELGIGKVLVWKKQYADALAPLEAAAQQASEVKVSDEAGALLKQCFAALEAGGMTSAVSAAEANAKLTVGQTYLDQKKFDQAQQVYQSALGSCKDEDIQVKALEGLGQAYEGKNDLDSAIGAYQRIVDEHPRLSSDGLFREGLAYNQANKPNKAPSFLQGAWASAITDGSSKQRIADIADQLFISYYSQGLYRLALQFLGQVNAKFPKTSLSNWALIKSGQVLLLGLHQPANAKAVFTGLMNSLSATEAGVTECKYYIAYCSVDEKDWKAARSQFQALYDDPQSDQNFRPSAMFMIGDCCSHLGEDMSARLAFEQVTSLFPSTEIAKAAAKRLSVAASASSESETKSR